MGLDGLGLSSVWVQPDARDRIFVTVLEPEADGPRVLRSNDGGATWARADAGLPQARIWSISGDDAETPSLIVTTASGIFRSANLGTTWICVEPCAPWDESTILTAKLRSRDPVRLTRDGGETWRTLSAGLGSGESIVLALEPYRLREGVFYLARGMEGQGVMRVRLSAGG